MLRLFLQRHLFTLLKEYESAPIPLDLFLKRYFQAHRALGANDRRHLCEAVYGMIRWQGLLDHLEGDPNPTCERRYAAWEKHKPCTQFSQDASLPYYIRASCPETLFKRLSLHRGEAAALDLSLLLNEQAPTTVRVNLLKTTREALFERWKGLYDVSLTPRSPLGITFHRKIGLFALPEFKEGLFEVQDEGSQLVAELAAVRSGDEVLDFCAGAGGKALAIASKLAKKGQIYLHDVRESALFQAKTRLKRAGIENAQLLPADSTYKGSLKGRMEWVIVDAPCTGTGTLRRNPDMKWKYSDETLERLVQEQRKIVREARDFLKPNGKLLYATCSILREENEEQIAYFERELGLKCRETPFQTLPQTGGADGFFAAVLQDGQ